MIGEGVPKVLALVGADMVTHDDALVLRAQKHEAGLQPDWWKRTQQTDRVTHYMHAATQGLYKGQLDETDNPADWIECRERSVTLKGGNQLVAYSNTVDIRLRNLWKDFRRRYRLGLEAVADAGLGGIVDYRGRFEHGTRERLEALRHRLKQHWKVAAYEWNIVFAGALAETLFTELGTVAAEKGFQTFPETVYIKGRPNQSGKDAPLLVKCYRGTVHGMPELVKLEITLRGEFLKRNGLRNPAEWETQPDIQERVGKALAREMRGVLTMLPVTSEMLTREMGCRQPELVEQLLTRPLTLTERVATLEQQMRDTQKRLERLERERRREW